MRAKHVSVHGGGHYGLSFWCPGCEDYHSIPTKPHPQGWEFNGDYERPTVSPSILVHAIVTTDGRQITPTCHSFVREGRIEFLGDCTHVLAGETVDLPDVDQRRAAAKSGGGA